MSIEGAQPPHRVSWSTTQLVELGFGESKMIFGAVAPHTLKRGY